MSEVADNLGTRPLRPLPEARFPEVGGQARGPAPYGGGGCAVGESAGARWAAQLWIRSQHRVGRRSRENMIWPQVDLAQMAALLAPDYTRRDRGRHRAADGLGCVRAAAAGQAAALPMSPR